MAIRNYLKVFADGHTEATVEKPAFGEVSATGDYYINGLWHDKLGVVYPTQFTYASQDDKLATFLIENGQPVDITFDDDSPSIVQNVIQAKDMVVTNKVTAKDISIYVVDEDYLDPLAIGTNPQAKLYNDGTVIGSTDNGEYTRWVSGELECSFRSVATVTTSLGSASIFYSPETNYTFPIQFISIPIVSISANEVGGYAVWGGDSRNLTTSGSLMCICGTTAATIGTLSYIAKGRWK